MDEYEEIHTNVLLEDLVGLKWNKVDQWYISKVDVNEYLGH